MAAQSTTLYRRRFSRWMAIGMPANANPAMAKAGARKAKASMGVPMACNANSSWIGLNYTDHLCTACWSATGLLAG